jgi:hypothetical protein
MSLYSQATLAFFPSGYKENTAFSVVPSSGSGDFTFSRTTDAYRLNGSSIVEKAPYNPVAYSQDFTNGSWTKNNCTVVGNAVAAPNGSMTAASFSENATTAQHLVVQQLSVIAGNNYTWSVYAKAGNQSTLCMVMPFTPFGSNWRTAYFNLSNGTVVSNNNNSGIAPTITSVGNGWYRCTFTNTCTVSGTDSHSFGENFFSQLGDGQVNLYLWGAQLDLGNTAKTYFPTTNRQNVPQLDWEGSTCPYLNMDNTSTNLFTYSEDFTFNGAWGQNRCTMTANVAIAPNGTKTADLFTTTSTTIECMLRASISSAVNNVTQTTSVYVKRDTANYFRIRNLSMGGNAWFNLTNGTIGTIQGGQTARIFNVGNGWYRCTLTGTKGVSATDLFDIGFTDADNTQYPSSTVSGYLWGAQLETRVVATSYIPTGAATATRNIQGLSVANLQATNILSSNFTLYSEFIDYKFSNNSGIHIFGVGNATATDWLSIYRNFSSLLKISKKENNVVTDTNNLSVQVAEGNTIKVAIRCNAGTVRIYINGQIAYNTTFANPSLMTNSRFFQLDAGNLNSAMVKSILLYNTALTDTECVKLTTL